MVYKNKCRYGVLGTSLVLISMLPRTQYAGIGLGVIEETKHQWKACELARPHQLKDGLFLKTGFDLFT